jgi:exonuclease VII small subunit
MTGTANESKIMSYEDTRVAGKEAVQLLMSMQATLRAAKQEVTNVFAEMEKQKEALGLKGKAE